MTVRIGSTFFFRIQIHGIKKRYVFGVADAAIHWDSYTNNNIVVIEQRASIIRIDSVHWQYFWTQNQPVARYTLGSNWTKLFALRLLFYSSLKSFLLLIWVIFAKSTFSTVSFSIFAAFSIQQLHFYCYFASTESHIHVELFLNPE